MKNNLKLEIQSLVLEELNLLKIFQRKNEQVFLQDKLKEANLSYYFLLNFKNIIKNKKNKI